MKLPNRENATIKREKFTHYLLNVNHPVGGSKAKFFRGIGFDESNISQFERELYKIGKSNEVKNKKSSDDSSGANYMIIGSFYPV